MNSSSSNESASARVILRDAASERWLEFVRPREIVQARRLEEVVPGLSRVEEAVARDGVYAAGFVAYEAAPAFDDKLVVRPDRGFPLLWFGLYEDVEEVELPSPMPGADSPRIDWQGSVERAEFHREMARIKALIRSGDTYQVNYTYRLKARYAGDLWRLFLRLVAAQDAPYGAFVDTGEWVGCSASPELFFELNGGHIQCRPMKGTAERGCTQAEDLARAQGLQASEKERAENVMIVDMMRNDLGRVAQVGSVNVARLFEVERYPTIWQMTSTVEARTQAGLCEIFRALFPPASVTGAPKVRTMQIIAGLETLPRRLYTGAIGFFAPGRRAQFSVAIRTLLANRRTGCVEYGVGSGITWGSDPEAEWQECRAKAGILSAPPQVFSLLETMRWTPEEGYFLLEQHLARLQQSARYFGFRVILLELRRELEQRASGFGRARQKIRLLMTREGRVSLEAAALPEPEAVLQRVALAHAPVDSSDPFLYHKTTNRQVYEAARAACPGFDDVLLFNEKCEVTESTIANVAVEIEGRLCTPPVSCGLLAGTLRAHLLQQGELIERPIAVEEALRSRRVFLMNSVRGRYPVQVVKGNTLTCVFLLPMINPALFCSKQVRSLCISFPSIMKTWGSNMAEHHATDVLETGRQPAGLRPSALCLVSEHELQTLRGVLERGTLPLDLETKLIRLAEGDLTHRFVAQNCRLFTALLLAARSGFFKVAGQADCERLLRVLAYVRKDDDAIPDYKPGGFMDDQQEVRAVTSELRLLLSSFKAWRLRHQVPRMWLHN